MILKRTNSLWILAFSLWAIAVMGGFWTVLNYEKTPGITLHAPTQWPTQAPVALAPTGATLVLFVHPKCPCTKATLSELAILMTHCHERLTTYLFFLSPSHFSEDWSKDSLWKQAQEIPGVQLFQDKDGETARHFHATTSGQCFLYGQNGKLFFEGGITDSRGHSGDNPGRSAITSIVLQGHSDIEKTPVFGCELFHPSLAKT